MIGKEMQNFLRGTTSSTLERLTMDNLQNSWVSCDIINFTGGQLQIDTLSSDWKNFSVYVLTLCLAANVRNFVRFACSSAVQSSIHFGLTPTQNY